MMKTYHSNQNYCHHVRIIVAFFIDDHDHMYCFYVFCCEHNQYDHTCHGHVYHVSHVHHHVSHVMTITVCIIAVTTTIIIITTTTTTITITATATTPAPTNGSSLQLSLQPF